MANSNDCMFMGWNRPVAGRESNAVELFGTVRNFLSKQVDNGTIENFEPCILSSHGGNLNGFFLIRGEADKLNGLRNTDDFLELVTRCSYCLEGFGVVNGWTGDGVDEIMTQYQKNI